MGLLYTASPCTRCHYQPMTLLRYHIGAMGVYIGIATCRACEEIAPYFPSRENIPDEDARMVGIEMPHRYAAHVQKIAATRADLFPNSVPFDSCSLCGSTHIRSHHLRDAEYQLEDGIWLPCPRCVSGKIKLNPAGMWD
jgi:hypothetical protein